MDKGTVSSCCCGRRGQCRSDRDDSAARRYDRWDGYIASDEAEMIAAAFMQELKRRVTYLHGQGAYTGKEKKIMFCVMRKRQAPKAVTIVKDIDSRAFLIIASASEIYGEGYKDYYRKQI